MTTSTAPFIHGLRRELNIHSFIHSQWVLFWSTVLKTWSKCLWTCTKFLPLSVFILNGCLFYKWNFSVVWSTYLLRGHRLIQYVLPLWSNNWVLFYIVLMLFEMLLYLYLPSQSEDKSNQSWYCCSLNNVLVGYSSLEIKISLFVFYSNSIISELYLSTVFSLVSTQSLVTAPRCVLSHNGSPFYDDE